MLTSGGGCFLSQKTLTAQMYLINPINLSEAISFSVRGVLCSRCWVCNRAAVVRDGEVRLSPRSRLRFACRQREVIKDVTAHAVNIGVNQVITIFVWA